MKKFMVMVMVVAMLISGCSSVADTSTSEDVTESTTESTEVENQETKVIGVSLMTLQYEFFQEMKTGIETAAGDEYEIIFNDPALDLQTQIDAIENFCAQGVDAIILNAVDPDGIVTALETAEAKGIPVITVDMQPSSGTYETYIGSDNYLGGAIAAQWAATELLADIENPKVVVLTNPLSSSAIERADGFKDTIQELIPNVEIVAEQGADTREDFMSTMEDILVANQEIDLVFAYSAQGGLGAYDAINAAGREDEIAIIGFDASDEELTAIAEDGAYVGSIMQFPDKLGETCVECVTQVLNGEELEEIIGVEVGIYTNDGILYQEDLQ